jgi:hypothetical protein
VIWQPPGLVQRHQDHSSLSAAHQPGRSEGYLPVHIVHEAHTSMLAQVVMAAEMMKPNDHSNPYHAKLQQSGARYLVRADQNLTLVTSDC